MTSHNYFSNLDKNILFVSLTYEIDFHGADSAKAAYTGGLLVLLINSHIWSSRIQFSIWLA